VLDELLEASQPIAEIRSLEIPHQAVLYATDSPEQIEMMAKRILSGYGEIEVQGSRQI
jgi:hypothetical protein